MFKILKTCLSVLLNIVLLSQVNGQWIKLHGMMERNTLKLYWETHDWPEDLYGFNIKRKVEGSTNWIKLNKKAISPQFNENSDWANQGMNEKQTEYIKEKFKEYLNLGKLQVIKNDRFLELLKNAGGLKSGDRINMKNDYDLAFMSGFGFIDNTRKKNKKYTYGIFYVLEDWTERNAPEATFSIVETDDLKTNLSFEKIPKGISTSWKMSSKDAISMGIFGFNIYRSKERSKTLEKVNRNVIGFLKTENDSLIWMYQDSLADNTKAFNCAIAPVNMFQKEIKRFKKKYDPKLYQRLEVPSIDTLQLVNDIQVLVKWKTKFSKKEIKKIKSLTMERAESNNFVFKPISDKLLANTEQFIDSVKKEYGKVYLYRLVCVDGVNKKWYSKTKSILFLGELKPSKPVNAKAEFKMIKQNPKIVLSWDLKAKNDSLTKGYLIASDELRPGNLMLLGSLPMISTNKYTHSISTNGGREYKFKIIPVSPQSVHGPAAIVKCHVPLLEAPAVSEFKVSLTKDNNIKLKWNLPAGTPVKGFNILMNGKTIAKYQDVGPAYREWTIKNSEFEKEGLYEFVIQSVGELLYNKSTRKTLYLEKKEQKQAILKPENLRAKIIKKKKGVLLKWNKVDLEKTSLLGFILYVDSKAEGKLLKQTSMPLIKRNEYLYKIKDTKRKQYTFGIAAVHKNGKIGSYTKVKVDISEKNNRKLK